MATPQGIITDTRPVGAAHPLPVGTQDRWSRGWRPGPPAAILRPPLFISPLPGVNAVGLNASAPTLINGYLSQPLMVRNYTELTLTLQGSHMAGSDPVGFQVVLYHTDPGGNAVPDLTFTPTFLGVSYGSDYTGPLIKVYRVQGGTFSGIFQFGIQVTGTNNWTNPSGQTAKLLLYAELR